MRKQVTVLMAVDVEYSDIGNVDDGKALTGAMDALDNCPGVVALEGKSSLQEPKEEQHADQEQA